MDNWISVEERLPEANPDSDNNCSDSVLLRIRYNGYEYERVCWYCHSDNKWYSHEFVAGYPIEWKPLESEEE
jgi:hypothetical protein